MAHTRTIWLREISEREQSHEQAPTEASTLNSCLDEFFTSTIRERHELREEAGNKVTFDNR